MLWLRLELLFFTSTSIKRLLSLDKVLFLGVEGPNSIERDHDKSVRIKDRRIKQKSIIRGKLKKVLNMFFDDTLVLIFWL